MNRIGIIGGGAWGTALATVMRRAGRETVIWVREPEVVQAINRRHENPIFLPGTTLDPGIHAVSDITLAVRVDAILLVVPSQFARATVSAFAAALAPTIPVVICAKGIERGSGRLMTEVVAEVLPETPLAVLSGPTFAAEVARGQPTAVTLACGDESLGHVLAAAFGTRRFRPYVSDDPIGAEIGGAVKNVLAIACGIVAGREFGDSARAALITRGLAEMARLGAAKGAKPETMMGLSGLGDLALTCNGPQSRNMSLGIALGRGKALSDILAARRSVAEGVVSSISVTDLAASLGVEMPISAAVRAILHAGADIDTVIEGLLSRPFRDEWTGA